MKQIIERVDIVVYSFFIATYSLFQKITHSLTIGLAEACIRLFSCYIRSWLLQEE
ncbi:MAG: hypothetical protein ACRCZZ_00645 [Phocaeicola sp.]